MTSTYDRMHHADNTQYAFRVACKGQDTRTIVAASDTGARILFVRALGFPSLADARGYGVEPRAVSVSAVTS